MMRGLLKIISENKKIYLLSVMFGLLVVEPFFVAQVVFFLPEFKLQYVVLPILLGLTVGFLLGTVMALRKQLSRQADLFHAIADQAFEFSFYRQPGGRYLYVSPAVETLTGYPPDAFLKDENLLRECIHPDDRPMWDDHVHEVDEDHVHNPLLIRIHHKTGSIRWVRHLCSSVEDENGEVIGIRSTNADVTNEVEVKEKIEHLANFDPLTELPNRRYLEKNIDELIIQAEEEQKLFGVLFVDLDRFKYINDSYGHSFGDRFLRLIGKRLKRNTDNDMMVSRFGGDEFVVTTPLLDTPEAAAGYAELILKMLERPVEIKSKKLYVSASIGISIYPYDGHESEALIKNADAAMYHSKDEGIGNIRFASSRLTTDSNRVLTLETRLRHSLENKEFFLHYQPKVTIPDGQLIGYEALARWQTGENEMISPAEFIPLAEETGLIVPLARQLMKELCEQTRTWMNDGFLPAISVNVSARQFSDPDCSRQLIDRWLTAGLPAEMLEIEVTESMIMENFESVVEQLKYLRDQGVKISLDDFGTGYSSLGYLRDLPVDTLKIDRTFVSNLHSSPEDEGVIEAIVALANNFGMDVIAEGVENEHQMNILCKLGCNKAQGYYFGKPVSPEIIQKKNIVASKK